MTARTGPTTDGATLIIQPLPGIGDMIWHLPFVHAIAAAAPDRKVSLLVKPRTQADRLLDPDPAVDRVYWLNRNPGKHDGVLGLVRLARLIGAGNFATVWILHGSWRYGLAARLSGIPRRIGVGRGLQGWFVNGAPPLANSDGRGHPIEQAAAILSGNGLPVTDREPRLVVCKRAAARVQRRFAKAPKPWVALGLGSSESYKQWGPENFRTLATHLAADGEASVFLIGGPDEAEIGSSIEAHVEAQGGAVENAIGLPIEDSVALTAACRAFVGNDTGLLNVAAAVSVDAIGLFGGSPPLTYSARIRSILPEQPGAGMAGIPVDWVFAAVRQLIDA